MSLTPQHVLLMTRKSGDPVYRSFERLSLEMNRTHPETNISIPEGLWEVKKDDLAAHLYFTGQTLTKEQKNYLYDYALDKVKSI